ncbi:hypothetical protein [Mucilaginibacter aquaedulcis]|uniref:hypothetical protein n=1 Tax=Mucilaginibacter aquaedulcis TaxID=1187081 RepID=UPI0025B5DEF3|nr:hypothetical protein [Mucilaginibacter aquaedulcis]MDN3549809.1 hypothetical protein [Mucilaginibacter aquaedulcis]
MKKILLTLIIVTATMFTTLAQTKIGNGKFSVGLEAGLPVGDASNYADYVIGGSLKYELPVANNLFITGTAGYSSIHAKGINISFSSPNYSYEFHSDGGSAGLIPVKVGAKYYFDKRFFGEGQLGAAFTTSGNGSTLFVYSPGVGYTFDGGFEAGFRYEAWSNNGTIGQLALRLAYRF